MKKRKKVIRYTPKKADQEKLKLFLQKNDGILQHNDRD
jgi:hypothetical protein